MLIRNLGQGYLVWDKAASIRFIKPGNSALFARSYLDDDDLSDIRVNLELQPSIDRVYHIDFKDAEGNICASVEKKVYIARSKQ
jgi:hypothetical protein